MEITLPLIVRSEPLHLLRFLLFSLAFIAVGGALLQLSPLFSAAFMVVVQGLFGVLAMIGGVISLVRIAMMWNKLLVKFTEEGIVWPDEQQLFWSDIHRAEAFTIGGTYGFTLYILPDASARYNQQDALDLYLPGASKDDIKASTFLIETMTNLVNH